MIKQINFIVGCFFVLLLLTYTATYAVDFIWGPRWAEFAPGLVILSLVAPFVWKELRRG